MPTREVAEGIKQKMEELSQNFPEGLEYAIHYDTTNFIEISIAGVVSSLCRL